ncbi:MULTISPECIES: serine hydrolase [Spirulina sp. CCY15215]|uniref:serine hydrolase n=1 Tax=Spirulina sp. CCY15215 TaxID=2767591 RepID=UPI00194E7149|nr:serine hydrolase [Spirulina major]
MMTFKFRWNRLITSIITLGICFGCGNPLQNLDSNRENSSLPNDCLLENQPKRTSNPFTVDVDLAGGNVFESRKIRKNQPIHYVFEGEPGQTLYIEPNSNTASAEQKICVNIFAPGVEHIQSNFLRTFQVALQKKGKYTIDLSILQGTTTYDLTLRLDQSTINFSPSRPSTKLPVLSSNSSTDTDIYPASTSIKRVYNPSPLPQLRHSQKLQSIIDEILRYQTTKGKSMPRNNISITLIDIQKQESANHQGDIPRFPASVVKLFWMVIFYDQFSLDQAKYYNSLDDMEKMMIKSDNKAASNVVDLISDAPSKAQEKGYEYKSWHQNRLQMNDFFKVAGYTNINISQKPFPFPFPELGEYGKSPKGYEARMRGNPNNPIRNAISTDYAARLMYEIVEGKAVPEHGTKMRQLLTRDLYYDWNQINPQMEFNPVLRFFGEYLPSDITLVSKAGWTSRTRQEVAYISTGNTEYILAIFLDEAPSYAQDITLFPKLSCLVFERMTERTCNQPTNN